MYIYTHIYIYIYIYIYIIYIYIYNFDNFELAYTKDVIYYYITPLVSLCSN